MPKQLTCAEILAGMRKETPGHLMLLKDNKTGREVALVINTEGLGGWDVYTFKSHGHMFTRIAKGISSEMALELIKFVDPIAYESGRF